MKVKEMLMYLQAEGLSNHTQAIHTKRILSEPLHALLKFTRLTQSISHLRYKTVPSKTQRIKYISTSSSATQFLFYTYTVKQMWHYRKDGTIQISPMYKPVAPYLLVLALELQGYCYTTAILVRYREIITALTFHSSTLLKINNGNKIKL